MMKDDMKTLFNDVLLEASSPHCKVAHLLWNTHRVAEQALDQKTAEWSAQELTGYSAAVTLPDYRRLQARIWARSAATDWVPLQLPAALASRYFSVSVIDSAGALADLLDKSGVRIEFPFTAEELAELRYHGKDPGLEFTRYISRGKLEGVLRHIRHHVREWAFRQVDPTGVLPEKAASRKRGPLWQQFLRWRTEKA
jgi:hypothetical protein